MRCNEGKHILVLGGYGGRTLARRGARRTSPWSHRDFAGRRVSSSRPRWRELGDRATARRVDVEGRALEGLSAHADFTELLDWLAASELRPEKVFVTHGEPAASDAMRRRLVVRFGWTVLVPEHGRLIDL